MPLPSAKEIAKLAKACRAAGIVTFKGEGIEFTLGDAPTKAPKAKARADAPIASTEAPESEGPGYDEMLFWSVPSLETKPAGDSHEN